MTRSGNIKLISARDAPISFTRIFVLRFSAIGEARAARFNHEEESHSCKIYGARHPKWYRKRCFRKI